jgi:hypothetical protein
VRLRALVVAGIVSIASVATADETATIELRSFSLATPPGWVTTSGVDASRAAFAQLAEPILRKLVSTPPPVLLSVRAAAGATATDGRVRLFAAWALIAGDAAQVVLDLRGRHDAATWSVPPDFAVREVVALGPALVQGRAATRFTFDLTDGSRVMGTVFSLPDRPDALATIALVAADPAAPDLESITDATIASIAFGSREERRQSETEAASFRGYLRDKVWKLDGAPEGLLFIRRIALMAVLFCVLFGGQLKLAQIFVQKRNARHKAAGDDRELRSERFILPISIVSITLTALAVSWLVTA